MRARTMTSMSRNVRMSASSPMRPCPGITYVPPSCRYVGTAMSSIVFSAVDEPVDAAAGFEVDDGILLRRHEDVAGDEHVGAAEVDDDVAVGVRARNVVEEDGLAVEIEIAAGLEERVQRHLRDGPIGGRHAREHVLVRDDRGRIAVHGHAGLRDRLVAARVVEVRARVDDPANRPVRQLADRGEQRLARRSRRPCRRRARRRRRSARRRWRRRRRACARCPGRDTSRSSLARLRAVAAPASAAACEREPDRVALRALIDSSAVRASACTRDTSSARRRRRPRTAPRRASRSPR